MAKTHVTMKVNGAEVEGLVEPRTLLVHFIRENLLLTGTHIGCDTTQCGACTVLVDGRSAKSCTLFAVQADGSTITTIEGLAPQGGLHPLPEGFGLGRRAHAGTSSDVHHSTGRLASRQALTFQRRNSGVKGARSCWPGPR